MIFCDFKNPEISVEIKNIGEILQTLSEYIGKVINII